MDGMDFNVKAYKQSDRVRKRASMGQRKKEKRKK